MTKIKKRVKRFHQKWIENPFREFRKSIKRKFFKKDTQSNKVDSEQKRTIPHEAYKEFMAKRVEFVSPKEPEFAPYRNIPDRIVSIQNRLLWESDGIDAGLIKFLRDGGSILVKDVLDASDTEVLKLIADHLYIAYLRRCPAEIDRVNFVDIAIKHNGFCARIAGIKSSPEFKATGFRGIQS